MQFEQQQILVTGGAGFIGSHIVETLLTKTKVQHVRVVDNLSTGFLKNISALLKQFPKRLSFMYGDIAHLDTCRQAVENMTLVCHQAALGSVPRSVKNPWSSHQSNVNGFLNMLIACKEADIKRFVYASSSSVYGDAHGLPKVESKIGHPLSPYAATKRIDEIYAKVFTSCYQMECMGLRYFNIFGPRQNPNGPYAAVIPKFIAALRQNDTPTIFGDGTQSRDFTYVANAVSANLLALTTKNKQAFGEVFNIGTDNQITLNVLYKMLCQALDVQNSSGPKFGCKRPGDVAHSRANIDKAKMILGYEPIVSFTDGLKLLCVSL